jgi:hypothetical protein
MGNGWGAVTLPPVGRLHSLRCHGTTLSTGSYTGWNGCATSLCGSSSQLTATIRLKRKPGVSLTASIERGACVIFSAGSLARPAHRAPASRLPCLEPAVPHATALTSPLERRTALAQEGERERQDLQRAVSATRAV